MITFSSTYADSDISDTGMVPRGLRVFSLAADRPEITIPSSARMIPAAVTPANGASPMQMAAPPQGNGSGPTLPPAEAARPVLANDPLAGMTQKQVFFRCIWLSKESAATKLMLVCIWRFFDANAQSSSMSYAQIAADCTLHESSAKRIAKDILGKWLTVGVQKGFKTGSGKQNLYHGICPPELVEELRELKRKGKDVEADEDIMAAADAAVNGVSSGHPLGEQGVASGDPLQTKGSHQETPQDQGVASGAARGRLIGGVTLDIPIDEEEDSRGAVAPRAYATREGALQAFERFWAAFPPGRKRDKGDARDLFVQIVTGKHKKRRASADTIVAAVERYAASKPDPQYAPMPTTWLNGGRWEDDICQPHGSPPAPPLKPGLWRNPALRPTTAAGWQQLIDAYAKDGWPVDMLGPPPGAPGCVIPADIIPHLRIKERR